ncbi:hypothetical protein BRO54_1781 [Geobacillus proteiniphilus]|uniref:Uncharacterized protein n=1 Tax=Geobacillus proteiniphilus TaxID=860353 RepID=A0A1Q5T1D7_9BACL|nr:hypothetical protein BRO54_1781 [Geobacillus proteiniphilus]
MYSTITPTAFTFFRSFHGDSRGLAAKKWLSILSELSMEYTTAKINGDMR